MSRGRETATWGSNEKKCVSISLPLHLSLDEGRNEKLLQQNCLSLVNYNPLEQDTFQKTMVDHNTFSAQFLLFDQSLKIRASWVIGMGKYEMEGVRDCLWGKHFWLQSIMQEMYFIANCPPLSKTVQFYCIKTIWWPHCPTIVIQGCIQRCCCHDKGCNDCFIYLLFFHLINYSFGLQNARKQG